MTDPEHAPGPLTMENVKRLEREQEAAASEALDANVNANANANVSSVTMDTADMLGEGPRHGALLQAEAEDWVLLESPYMTHWNNKRHNTNGIPRARRASDMPDWRMRERLRTVTAALVMCLNIGVDPPDVSKTNPCSKLICWMDPESLDASKALPAIGRNLQVQFETLSMKTRYKQYLDPIVEETKRFCTNLRRTAKDERVLFYYNGYGVPKPTPGGEIWVFNKAYTQYIPLTLYDLQTWLGQPCIYVWDTSAAGHIVANFRRLAEARAEDEIKAALAEGREPPPMPNPDGITIDATGEPQFPLRDSIHLAACGADEVLPMNPDLPADLFTCCLTSPIEISLRWFVLQNPLPSPLNVDMVMNIPGRLQDRRTPLGELNWTLTAVTDTIAWTVLPRALFRRFFRDDLMVAALLRNYLLAERIMRFYHCTPVSHPRLPPTHNHPLWDSWDLAVDQCLSQLPTLLAKEQARADAENLGIPMPPHLASFEYRHSTFFSEQLKAFEVWLSQGDVSRHPPRRRVQRHPVVRVNGSSMSDVSTSLSTSLSATSSLAAKAVASAAASATGTTTVAPSSAAPDLASSTSGLGVVSMHRRQSAGPGSMTGVASGTVEDSDSDTDSVADDSDAKATLSREHDPPSQLPIVLQVLLSQVHRLRALILLSQFLDLGPWAVNLALSIGIFPYVLKLLQSPAADLKPVLIYIWARILAVDHSCQVDLLRDNGYLYFAAVLSPFQPGQMPGHGVAAVPTTAVPSTAAPAVATDAHPMAHAHGGAAAGSVPNVGGATAGQTLPIPNVSEHRAMCAFILAVFCQDFSLGQDACLETDVMDACLEHLEDDDYLLRQWSALCLAQLWDNNDVGKARAIAKDAHGKLCCLLSDASPEVRAAILYALGVLLGTSGGALCDASDGATSSDRRRERARGAGRPPCICTGALTGLTPARQRNMEVGIAMAILASGSDCSPLVRKELVIALSALVHHYHGFFVLAAYLYYMRDTAVYGEETPTQHAAAAPADMNADIEERLTQEERLLTGIVRGIIQHGESVETSDVANVPAFVTLFVALLDLSVDAHPEVANLASTVVDQIMAALVEHGALYADNSTMRQKSLEQLSQPHIMPTAAEPLSAAANHTSSLAGAAGALGATATKSRGSVSSLPSGMNTRASASANASATDSRARPNAASRGVGVGAGVGSGAGYAAATTAAATVGLPGYPSDRGFVDPSADEPAGRGSTIARTIRAISSIAGTPAPSHAPAKVAPVLTSVAAPTRAAAASADGTPIATYKAPYGGGSQQPVCTTSQDSFSAGMPTARSRREVHIEDALAECIAADLHRLSVRGRDDMPPTTWLGRVQEQLPLKSRLFEWCSEYYTEPQMKSAEADEPGSSQYNRQMWRRQRCEQHMAEAMEQVDDAGSVQWSERVGMLTMPSAVQMLCFHEYDPHVVSVTDQDTLCVWDWQEQRLLSSFCNGHRPHGPVTSLAFINEEVDALLLTGAADGHVHIYRQYARGCGSKHGPELVSAFRVLPDLLRSRYPSGVRVTWQQVSGRLLAGGDSRLVRLWDAHRELCISDVPTHVNSCATSLTSDTDIGHLFMAGFGDGSIGVYDQRNPPTSSLVQLWEEHNAWVQTVHLQRHGARELVSASVDGQVRVWDIRARSSVLQCSAAWDHASTLSDMAVHDRIPVLAATSSPHPGGSSHIHTTQMYSLADLSPLGRPYQRPLQAPSLLSSGPARSLRDRFTPPSRYSPSTSIVAFHPHHPVLAFGGPDHLVEIFRYV